MIQARRLLGGVGDVAYGLTQSGGTQTLSLAGELVVVPSQMAYLHIPAAELRNFVDEFFPNLAINKIADSASGFGHRYRAGHDLLLDVPSTFYNHGSLEGIKHAGHIILTDFPTKAGIPIPGFSQSGFGHILEQVGISHGWLHLSLFDAGVGILAIADGSTALIQALQGSLSMDFGAACQTFGMGSAELGLAITTQNPLMLAGGVQNILAGVIATWNTFSVYVDPLDLLGSVGMSALLGFGIAHCVVGENLSKATQDAARSGVVGGLFAISSAFGFGALAGFVACRLGKALAECHNLAGQARLTVDSHSYRMLVQELCDGNIQVRQLLDKSFPGFIFEDGHQIRSLQGFLLPSCKEYLSCKPVSLNSQSRSLKDESIFLNASLLPLSDDPKSLSHVFRKALNMGL